MVAVMLGLTVTMNNALYETTQQTNAASTLATVGEIAYTDLNQTVKTGFTTAYAQRMVFQADTSLGGGKLATITYQVDNSSTQGLLKLTRTVGGTSVVLSDNLKSVQFQYFDVNGNSLTTPVASPSVIDAIRVKLVAQVSDVVAQNGVQTLNDFKVFPPNLN